jgi:hypothetical protein
MVVKEIIFLSIATAIILIVLGLILIYLIIRKAKENRQTVKVEAHKNEYYGPLIDYLLTGELTRKLLPDTPEKKLAIEELLSRYSETIEGEEEKKNLYKMAESYLSEYYKLQLKSRNWSNRVNTLYHIEDFRMLSLEMEIKELLSNAKLSKSEKVLCLRILALFDNNDLFEELTSRHPELSEFDYRSILFRAGEQKIAGFVSGFHKCQPVLQYAILDILALKKELNYTSFLEDIYKSHIGELRLRALKTLASIGYVSNLKEYLPLSHSEKWEERMMIAKLIGVMHDQEGLKSLVELLHDPIWWVRSQAGQSIKNYPKSREILMNIYETTVDPYARDMAWEWLNKGE